MDKVVALECLPEKPGYAKIQLSFLTYTPKHIRSEILRSYGLHPPFPESIMVLVPEKSAFSKQSLTPIFHYLQQVGLISSRSSLIDFKWLEQDKDTLAYVVS